MRKRLLMARFRRVSRWLRSRGVECELCWGPGRFGLAAILSCRYKTGGWVDFFIRRNGDWIGFPAVLMILDEDAGADHLRMGGAHVAS